MKISKNKIRLPSELAEYVVNMSPEDSDELRVLVYILSHEGEPDTDEIREHLGLSDTEVISAVSFWRGAGYISSSGKAKTAKKVTEQEKAKPEDLPASVRDTDTRTYSGEEAARIIEEKPELSSLLDFAQNRLERIFSPADIAKLVYLEDYVLLTPPMIMRIIDYCVEMDKKSMRYVEKTALSIYDEGICDYESLEAYFERKKAARSAEGIVRRIVGTGTRNFTSSEKAHIAVWFEKYKSSEELITLAYEKTIANISKPSIPYMSKLLGAWNEKGYKCALDVENGTNTSQNAKNPGFEIFDEASADKTTVDGSINNDLEDFFENT